MAAAGTLSDPQSVSVNRLCKLLLQRVSIYQRCYSALSPLTVYMLKTQPPALQSRTVFGGEILKEVSYNEATRAGLLD